MLQRTLVITSILGILLCPYVCSGHQSTTCCSFGNTNNCLESIADEETDQCCDSGDCCKATPSVISVLVFHPSPVDHDFCGEGNCVLATATSVSLQKSIDEINQGWMTLLKCSYFVVIPQPVNLSSMTQRNKTLSEQCSRVVMRFEISSLII